MVCPAIRNIFWVFFFLALLDSCLRAHMFPIRYFFFQIKKKTNWRRKKWNLRQLWIYRLSRTWLAHIWIWVCTRANIAIVCWCIFFFPKWKQNKQKIITKRNIQKSHKIKRTKNQLKNSVVSFPRWSMNDRTSRYYFSLIIGGSSCELILKSRRISIVQYTIKYKFLLYYLCTQLICK